MKILFLTYDLPYPLVSGGKIRAYYLIKSLSRNHRLTLFSYYRDEEQRQYLPELRKYCSEIYLFKRRKPWSWQNLLRAFLTPLPFAPATYHSPELEAALKKELKTTHYDLVHFESFYPALYLPLVEKLGAKTLLGNENVEYQIYQRFADSRRFPLLRWLLKLEVFRLRLFEENLWRQADANLAVSKGDAATIERLTKKPCSIITNGVDPKVFQKIRNYKKRRPLIFIGTLLYPANNDAMKFFFQDLYPEIKRRAKGVKFILVSWHKSKWLKEYLTDPSVELIQDKETPAGDLLGRGGIFVAPMRVASGTNIKVLEGMAAGLPVVTTTVGIEGIEAKDGKEVVVRDKPEEFINEVIKLLGHEDYRREVGRGGKALVERKYDWGEVGKNLEKVYQELVYDRKKN